MSEQTIAFTFPGQGSQSPGMGKAWMDHESWELVEEASESSGRDVQHLLLNANEEELKETHNSQLATYVTSMIVLDAISRLGVDAAFFAGHSLGEYSALTAAGVLSYSSGVKLVAERGEAMRSAAEEDPGTMAAVLGLEDEQVELCCNRIAGDVWVANYNSPGQVVIAGTEEGVELASVEARNEGAKRVLPIKVGGAFHTTLMSPARDRLMKALKSTEFRNADHPVFANVDAMAHTQATDWETLLAAQLTSPVRWKHILLALEDEGVNVLVELGAGSVLTGMSKRTVKDANTISISTPADIDTLLDKLAKSKTSTELPTEHNGESLYAIERLVISPSPGVFKPIKIDTGEKIERGQLIGTVGDAEVNSPFAGYMQGLLALDGEKVNTSQPLAWLRIKEAQ